MRNAGIAGVHDDEALAPALSPPQGILVTCKGRDLGLIIPDRDLLDPLRVHALFFEQLTHPWPEDHTAGRAPHMPAAESLEDLPSQRRATQHPVCELRVGMQVHDETDVLRAAHEPCYSSPHTDQRRRCESHQDIRLMPEQCVPGAEGVEAQVVDESTQSLRSAKGGPAQPPDVNSIMDFTRRCVATAFGVAPSGAEDVNLVPGFRQVLRQVS